MHDASKNQLNTVVLRLKEIINYSLIARELHSKYIAVHIGTYLKCTSKYSHKFCVVAPPPSPDTHEKHQTNYKHFSCLLLQFKVSSTMFALSDLIWQLLHAITRWQFHEWAHLE